MIIRVLIVAAALIVLGWGLATVDHNAEYGLAAVAGAALVLISLILKRK